MLSGALADRYDPRRMIQIGMVLFACCSLAWGVLFLTDTLQMWHAIAILTMHGFAAVFWGTPGQVLLHDMVGIDILPSAVRLNSTGRYLGLLAGPAVGGAVMLAFGPAHGILLNIFSFLPLVLLMWKAPYGPAFRKEKRPPRPIRGYGDIFAAVEGIRGNRIIISIILLASCSATFVASGYQAQMPEFAHDLGHGDAGFFYSLLLAANALGALTAGFALEASGWLQPKPLTPFLLVTLWCCSLIGFALTSSYPVAVILMLITGFLGLAYDSMNQTLVQLNAPPADPRPRRWPLQHVRARAARLQRRDHRRRRQLRRRTLVAGIERVDVAGPGDAAALPRPAGTARGGRPRLKPSPIDRFPGRAHFSVRHKGISPHRGPGRKPCSRAKTMNC